MICKGLEHDQQLIWVLLMLHASGNTWPLYLRWSTAHSPLTHPQSSLIIVKRLRNGCRGLLRHLVRRGQWNSLNHSSKKLVGDWERTGDELAWSFRSDEWNLLLLLRHSIKLISNGSICPEWYDGYWRHYCLFRTGVIYFPIKLGENAWRRFCPHKFKLDKHDTSSIAKMNGNICVRRQLPIPTHRYRVYMQSTYKWIKKCYTLVAVVFWRCLCCGPCLSPHYCRYNGLTLIIFFYISCR